MSNLTPTKTQRRVLQRMADGEVLRYDNETLEFTFNSAPLRKGEHVHWNTATSLLNNDWITHGWNRGANVCRLTDTGRKWTTPTKGKEVPRDNKE